MDHNGWALCAGRWRAPPPRAFFFPWRVASGPPDTFPRSQAFGGCASTSSCAGRSCTWQPACRPLTRRAATPFPLNITRRLPPRAGDTGVGKQAVETHCLRKDNNERGERRPAGRGRSNPARCVASPPHPKARRSRGGRRHRCTVRPRAPFGILRRGRGARTVVWSQLLIPHVPYPAPKRWWGGPRMGGAPPITGGPTRRATSVAAGGGCPALCQPRGRRRAGARRAPWTRRVRRGGATPAGARGAGRGGLTPAPDARRHRPGAASGPPAAPACRREGRPSGWGD